MKNPIPDDRARRHEALRHELQELGERVRAIKKDAERLARIAEAREKRLTSKALKAKRKHKG